MTDGSLLSSSASSAAPLAVVFEAFWLPSAGPAVISDQAVEHVLVDLVVGLQVRGSGVEGSEFVLQRELQRLIGGQARALGGVRPALTCTYHNASGGGHGHGLEGPRRVRSHKFCLDGGGTVS